MLKPKVLLIVLFFRDINALHFDPNKPEHEQFEINRSQTDKTLSSKPTAKDQKVKDVEDIPEVSKERFFKVEDNLKEKFKKSEEGFSLLSMFGKTDAIEKEMSPGKIM